MALQAEDFPQLNIDLALNEYRKIVESYVCPICTLVIEDIKQCSECEGILCNRCLQAWKVKSSACPLCKCEFEADRIPKRVLALFNDCEFRCPYNCSEVFKYEHRKKHFMQCQEVASVL